MKPASEAGPLSPEIVEHQGQLLEMMASGTEPARILARLTESLESFIPDSRCSILLTDGNGETLRHGAAPNLPSAYCQRIDGIEIGPKAGSCGTAAYRGSLVVARDTWTDPRWEMFRELAVEHGLRACWSSPITAPGQAVLGTFAIYHNVAREPTDRELALLDRFSSLAAVAIRHARLFQTAAENEERFRRSFEDNAAGMLLVDLEGRIAKVNAALCAITGSTEQRLLGSRFVDLLTDDHKAAAEKAMEGLVGRRGARTQLEASVRRRDGGETVVLLAVSVVSGPEGAPLHHCINVLDDTERQRTAAERDQRRLAEAARSVAEAKSDAKSQLLSEMTHELRTPLSAVIGFTEMLDTVDLSQAQRRDAVRHLSEAAGHILVLVEDLLDLAKIEAGVAEMHPADLALSSILGEAVNILEPLAGEREVTINVGETPARVHADPVRLRQALINVLANAIKYNRADGQVKVTADQGSGGFVTISICDTGPGIRSVGRSAFAPFERLGAQDGPTPGTGLGLTISKRFVEAMEGDLSIGLGPDSGTEVSIRLPAAPSRRRCRADPVGPGGPVDREAGRRAGDPVVHIRHHVG